MNPTLNVPDCTLMAHVADGDHDAFEELYRRHRPRVLLQARGLCSDRELAEDVAQEAFISLWRSAHAYRPSRGTVGAWLSTTVRNRAIDAWRRSSVRVVEVEAHDNVVGRQDHAADASAGFEDRARALSMLAQLPAAQKEVVFLAYFGELSHSEIATAAGVPLGTIKGRMRLGLDKLRSGLDEQPQAPRAALAGAGRSAALV